MDRFDKNFTRMNRVVSLVLIVQFLIALGIIVTIIFLGYTLLTDPSSIGEFFGEIVKGFKKIN